jgi:two-component SAPR family response regulator
MDTNFNTANLLHIEAMRLAQEADDLLRDAFEKEKEAALLLEEHTDFEPTRSVLFRSAASLAVQCGKVNEAEELVRKALKGKPPTEIAEECGNLLNTIRCERVKEK